MYFQQVVVSAAVWIMIISCANPKLRVGIMRQYGRIEGEQHAMVVKCLADASGRDTAKKKN